MRGCILSRVGPGASAVKSSIPPIPNKGKMATVKTIIPNPPIQWVMLRQIIIPGGRTSMSLNIVAPVVVRPETVSNSFLPDINDPTDQIRKRSKHGQQYPTQRYN